MNDYVSRLLASTDELLKKVTPGSAKVVSPKRAAVEAKLRPKETSTAADEKLDRAALRILEFYGTHYLPLEETEPRHIRQRPYEVQTVIHVFSSVTGDDPVIPAWCGEVEDPIEIICHRHPYNEGCFTSYRCWRET